MKSSFVAVGLRFLIQLPNVYIKYDTQKFKSNPKSTKNKECLAFRFANAIEILQ